MPLGSSMPCLNPLFQVQRGTPKPEAGCAGHTGTPQSAEEAGAAAVRLVDGQSLTACRAVAVAAGARSASHRSPAECHYRDTLVRQALAAADDVCLLRASVTAGVRPGWAAARLVALRVLLLLLLRVSSSKSVQACRGLPAGGRTVSLAGRHTTLGGCLVACCQRRQRIASSTPRSSSHCCFSWCQG